jgi:predicted DsbA family dithiol-disulfide isomerase
VPLQALYYTDPACPWSWALEPTLRRLEHEFAGEVEIRYVMAGMAREFGPVEPLVREYVEAGFASGMPVDPRVWWEGAPRSSYPACIAVTAAAEQGNAGPLLRRLREGLLCRRQKLDTTDALLDAARAVPGIDVERFRIGLGSHGALEAFGADLERARAVPSEHWAEGAERVKLPSLEFLAPGGARHGVYGPAPYEALRKAAVAAGARPVDAGAPGVDQALRRWGSLATAEVAEVCRLPGPRAPAELWQAAAEWRVRAEAVGTGVLWSLA